METKTIISNNKRLVVKALDEKALDVLEFALDDNEIYSNLFSYGSWEILSEMEL